MSFNLDSQTYGPLLFKPVIPAALAKWVIPGSHPYITKGKFGYLFLQQIEIGSANLFYTIAETREDLAIDFTIDEPLWLTHIALKNENRFDIDHGDPLCLKEGQFNMIRSSSIKGTLYMDAGHAYRMLSLYCPPEQLVKMEPMFPFLQSFISHKYRDPAMLFRNPHWINGRIRESIDHLLNCTYRSNLRRVYFDYKAKELLFLLLGREQEEILALEGLSNHTIEAVNEARYIMETGTGITLHSIAEQLGMSEAKLKDGMKLMYGI